LGADGVKILKPKGEIDSKYFYYFLQYIDLGSLGYARHYRLLKEINVAYPKSLPEQQRIVSILDESFAAIDKAKANAEQNLKNAKELFESYLQGVFENGNKNWEVNCLDELGTITSSKRIYKSEYVKDGIPFYRTKEIKELSNGKPITLELFISRQRYEQIKQSFGVPKIGDLLMSAVGTIGEIMVIENEDEFYFKDGNIVWFKDFEKLDTNYLKYALTAFVEKIKNLAIGAAYSALTIEKLNKYQIAFPSAIDDQQTIVRQLDALRAETQKLETVYQKKIADLEELKKSILQKAFAGELSELGFDGLKDDRIIDGKKEILQSSNLKNHNSDDDGLKDDRILKEKV
jgi:type I restriction enzyme S subunit